MIAFFFEIMNVLTEQLSYSIKNMQKNASIASMF